MDDVEQVLEFLLEEVKARKQRLKELEEEEQKLLDELSKLGLLRGTIVAKYVKCSKNCGECPHGVYD